MMTEDEAKKKWCPHVRIADEQGDSAALNRTWGMALPDATRCIGSACMAWRWWCLEEDGLHVVNKDNKKLGYCGLSGAPS